MVLGKLDRYVQENELDYHLTQHTINTKWIKALNIRPETMKTVEENIGSRILDIVRSNILLDISPQARETKEKINKWDIKVKHFCTAKEINKIKRQPTEWENTFTLTYDKGFNIQYL